jgi:phage terminase small subunit
MGSKNITARQSLVLVPPEKKLGPAMQALTPPQQRFVIAMVQTGGRCNARAAAMAGYGGTEEARWNAGYRLAHNAKVIAAIREEAERTLRSAPILATAVLFDIANDPAHKDRFKAAVELFNRAGMIVQTEHKVIVEDDRRTRHEIEEAIILLAKRNGLDPTKLLGSPAKAAVTPDVVDADYEEVDEDDISDLMGEAP